MTSPEGRVLRWGIVGTGTVSHEIADDFGLVDEAELTAVSSRTEASAQHFATAHVIGETYSDYDAMLRNVDAVYIATPHATHFEYAARALSQGCHVLCEKPLTANPEDARALADLARRHNAFLMEAMWMKFNPLFQKLSTLISEGAIGELRSVRATFGYPFPRDDSSRWKAEMQGSALLDQGIYPVTLAHMLLGVPTAINASGILGADGIDYSSHFTFEYPAGRFAQGASSMVDFLDLTASICGTDGFITIETGFWFASVLQLHQLSAGELKTTRVEVKREGHGYTPMLRSVTNSILNGATEHLLHPPAHSVEVLELLADIRQQLPITDPIQPNENRMKTK